MYLGSEWVEMVLGNFHAVHRSLYTIVRTDSDKKL